MNTRIDTPRGKGGRIDRNLYPYDTQINANRPVDTSLSADEIGTYRPIVVPPVTPSTASSGLEEFIASSNKSVQTARQAERDQDIARKEAEVKTQEKSTKSLLGKISDSFKGMNTANEKSEIYEDEKIDPLKAAVDEYTSQIEAEQLGVRRKIEKLDKNESGLYGGALEAEKNRIQNESTSKQADLAVLQSVASRNYNRAVDIANRKIDALTEDKRNELERNKFLYEENKDLFTTSEQRLYEEKLRKDEREYEKEKFKLQNFEDTKIDTLRSAAEQGAPMSVIQSIANSKDVEEVFARAGVYAGDILKRQKDALEIQKLAAERTSSGGYSEDQKKALTTLNENVSKNQTFSRTASMRNYANNVLTSLNQGTGVGDIAAINQFQKVIDEGAVTRDQDVSLIQSAQSLSNSLGTQISRLQAGEKLSPELRVQMEASVKALYNAQVNALKVDPYIQAKTSEAAIYGLGVNDTILGQLGNFDNGLETTQKQGDGTEWKKNSDGTFTLVKKQ